ncbi:MAG: response regulator [Proteobacteria bacterium]|nr:response regulator [Pseudomonadota bacterium]
MSNQLDIESKKGRILIIDDEPANLKLLNKIIGSQGYDNLVLIQDPREVLSAYKEQQTDLILLDINMPYMDGFEVMKKLKELNDPIMPPIIILTVQHGQEYLLRALNEGARDFVTKPFDRVELLARVRNLLEAHIAHRMLHDQKSVLDELVRHRTEELQKAQLEVINRLGMAAEYRDEDTGSHIIRMSHICFLLAQGIGWSQPDAELILHASPMHDVGKIGIPDGIMLKPAKLDADEWAIMKTHASIGGDLLKDENSPLMKMACEIALTHHEKWDGSGYPCGLSAEAIPQSGRIAALADVFDALTSERPYKKTWTIEAAVDLIKSESGQHFDPAIVEVFLLKLPQIIKICRQFSNLKD